jgi:pimeloyl-ACP methyl ester carboxylesterase
MNTRPSECFFLCRHGKVAAQIWGNKESPVVVLLHGWLDNSSSFHNLAKCMSKHYYVVALDLPGHGMSDHFEPNRSYYGWEYLEVLHQIMPQITLDKVSLIGHSMGANTCLLYAAAFPNNIHNIIILDSIGPIVKEDDELVNNMVSAIESLAEPATPLRIYPSIEVATQVRSRITVNVSKERIQAMVERSVCQVAGGLSWRTDQRLTKRSKIYFSESQVKAICQKIDVPVGIILASNGIIPQSIIKLREPYFSKSDLISIAGTHHFHMDIDESSPLYLSILALLKNE